MSHDAIGRRYARAIFEIGKEEGGLAGLAEQIADFALSYQASPELISVLENPAVPHETRASIVEEIAGRTGAGATTQRALKLITRKRRLRALPDIARHLRRLCDQDSRIVRAEVFSAHALTESYLTRLKSELETATGQKVVLSHTIDPTIIGGVVTRIGDRVVDGSLRSHLSSIRKSALAN